MTNKLLYNVLLPILISFISFSAIFLDKTPNAGVTIALGAGLFFCISLDRISNRFVVLQLALLFAFHWYSQLNWCISIYIIVLIRLLTAIDHVVKSVLLALSIMCAYSTIRMSYSFMNDYAVLITFSDILGSLALVALVWYIKNSENEKERLKEANNKLLHSDVLTGLLNYHEFRKSLEQLINQNKNTCVAIVDCYNIKTLNVQLGYQHINNTLKKIAMQLTFNFPDSAICRYSGGQFALAIEFENKEEVVDKIVDLFDAGIAASTGMQVIYGYAFSDGRSSDEIIAEIENQLFFKERELWLKRDEHIFRADKLKMIGELAAGMAHEIRNPLTTIKGFLQLAKRDDYKNMGKFYDIIMSEITRVSELTAEFLQFSKPQATKMKVESVQECIKRAVSITENEISRNGHQLIIDIPEAPPLPVKIDRDKITQVLINLIKNAVDAMPEVGELVIKAYELEQTAFIEVADSGIGMSEETIEKLFDPFFTTKEHGTGLGLPISHKIVQDHGGTIDVRSAVGQGTVFILKLPSANNAKQMIK